VTLGNDVSTTIIKERGFADRGLAAVKSRVAWGAIFAGALVAVALFFVLGSFSAAINLSIYDDHQSQIPAWAFALSVVSMFVGGWTTARLTAGETPAEAMFYGVVLWSFTALLLLYLAMNGILIFGSGTVLGQAGYQDLLIPMTKSAAWWGFAGVTLSLLASIGGAVAGAPGVQATRRKRRAMRLEQVTVT
jgi:hypothetical protein